MLREHVLPGEGFPTEPTPVRLLSRVSDLMPREPRLLSEGFAAVAADVRFLCVC